ncbi:MAG: hypothetical protein WAN65_23110 [Candidatus Sulfotelmatobacter sp.]
MGATEGYVGVLTVGLPAADQDARGLGGDALGLVDADGVSEREVGELASVERDLTISAAAFGREVATATPSGVTTNVCRFP